MKIKLQIVEGYHITAWKNPIEIDTDKYPELEGMTEDEALDYIRENSENMSADPEDPNCLYTIYDDLMDQSIELEKEKNYCSEIEKWTK